MASVNSGIAKGGQLIMAGRASVAPRRAQSLSGLFRPHLAAIKDRVLRGAETLAYDLSGLPNAVRDLRQRAQTADGGAPGCRLHRTYSGLVWGNPSLGQRLRLVLAVVLWPLALPVAIGLYTWRNGPAIRRRAGKSVPRQMAEQLQVAVRHSVAPPWYYMFELYLDDRRPRAREYVHRYETKGPIYGLLQPGGPSASRLNDKAWFAARCRQNGIAAVPVILEVREGRAIAVGGGSLVLPGIDLFVKPRRGRGGRNTERWDRQDAGIYKSSQGDLLSRSALLESLKQLSLGRDYIVQPRVVNHPDMADLSNGALATVRIVTCKDDRGGFEVTNAALRMAVGRNTVVDNFHAGGIASKVDLQSGELGAASDMGVRPRFEWCNHHPDTGAPIRGRKLPFWGEALRLVRQAHAAFPDRVIVGWDVGLLDTGPALIEANIKPDLDIHQRVEREPLGRARLAELLAFHVERRLEARLRTPDRPPAPASTSGKPPTRW